MTESHLAGLDVRVGPYLRQRCAWCGAVLTDHDLRKVAIQTDAPDKTVATWPVGEVIRVDGNMSSVIAHNPGDQLPEDSCTALDPSVTQ